MLFLLAGVSPGLCLLGVGEWRSFLSFVGLGDVFIFFWWAVLREGILNIRSLSLNKLVLLSCEAAESGLLLIVLLTLDLRVWAFTSLASTLFDAITVPLYYVGGIRFVLVFLYGLFGILSMMLVNCLAICSLCLHMEYSNLTVVVNILCVVS